MQVGVAAQRLGEHVADLLAPEVLVLDVDQLPGPRERLGVAARHRALAAAGERVVAAAAQVRVGPQQLDGLGAALGDRGRRLLCRQGVRGHVHPEQPVLGPVDRVPGQRGRVLPALPEDGLHVVHGRAGDGCLDVVPRWRLAVLRRHLERLLVAEVLGVVAPRVAQVDPAHVGDVLLGPAAVADHHHLLVVRAARADPHVQQCLGAAGLELPAEQAVLGGVEVQLLPVRAPDQPADVDPPLVGPAEHLDDLAPGLAGQALVGVALPVGEEHQVTTTGLLEPVVELGEVGRAVHERAHQVALGPRHLAVVLGVEPGLGVGALRLGQQPVSVVHGAPSRPGPASPAIPRTTCQIGPGEAMAARRRLVVASLDCGA